MTTTTYRYGRDLRRGTHLLEDDYVNTYTFCGAGSSPVWPFSPSYDVEVSCSDCERERTRREGLIEGHRLNLPHGAHDDCSGLSVERPGYTTPLRECRTCGLIVDAGFGSHGDPYRGPEMRTLQHWNAWGKRCDGSGDLT